MSEQRCKRTRSTMHSTCRGGVVAPLSSSAECFAFRTHNSMLWIHCVHPIATSLFLPAETTFPPCRACNAVLCCRSHSDRYQRLVRKNPSTSELHFYTPVDFFPVAPSMSAEDSPNQPNVLRNAIPMDVLRGHERLIALPPVESVVCVSPVSFRYDRTFINVMGVVRLALPQSDRGASARLGKPRFPTCRYVRQDDAKFDTLHHGVLSGSTIVGATGLYEEATSRFIPSWPTFMVRHRPFPNCNHRALWYTYPFSTSKFACATTQDSWDSNDHVGCPMLFSC